MYQKCISFSKITHFLSIYYLFIFYVGSYMAKQLREGKMPLQYPITVLGITQQKK